MNRALGLLLLVLILGCTDKPGQWVPPDPDMASEDLSRSFRDLGGPPGDMSRPTPKGWTWTNPLPQGNQLNGMWVANPNNACAVGESGTIV